MAKREKDENMKAATIYASCVICNVTFQRKEQLSVHLKSVHNSGGLITKAKNKNIICDICEKSFGDKNCLREHIRNVHEKIRNPETKKPTCQTCKKEFSKQSNLNFHIASIHINESIFKCSICDKKFKREDHLRSHHFKVHGEKQKHVTNNIANIKCEICEKSFADKSSLSHHVRKLHKFAEGYTCDMCNKVFVYENYLKLHIITVHNNERNFECKVCNKKFKQDCVLKRHITMIHSDNEKSKLTSEHKKLELKLDKELTNNDKHNVSEFQESTVDLVKLHICKKCDTVFTEKSHLDNHLVSVHKDEKNFQCSLCNRRYMTKKWPDQTLFFNACRRLQMK